MTLESPKFEPVSLLRQLNEQSVDYIVIGGIAATLRGSDSITGDLDICYRRTKDNIRQLLSALKAMNARLTNFPPELPFTLDERTVWNGDTFTLDTTFGRLDCLANPSGTRGFDDLVQNATDEKIGPGMTARVCSLDDLIRMKRAAGRKKDLIAVEQLTSLKRLIDGS
jgi:predicted nucleotidyltransferase